MRKVSTHLVEARAALHTLASAYAANERGEISYEEFARVFTRMLDATRAAIEQAETLAEKVRVLL